MRSGRSTSAARTPTLDPRVVWGAVVVWLALLPVGAALAVSDASFWMRVAGAVVTAVLGGAFTLFVGALLLEKWQRSAADAAAEAEAAEWDQRVRFVVLALLDDLRLELRAVIEAAYGIVAVAVPEREAIPVEYLHDSARIPHRLEESLADAVEQARALRKRVVESHSLLARKTVAGLDAEHADLRREMDPEWQPEVAPTAAELADRVDDETAAAIRAAARRYRPVLIEQAAELHRRVTELTAYVADDSIELQTASATMRKSARELAELELDDAKEAGPAMSDAAKCMNAATGMLNAAQRLARRSSLLYLELSHETRPGLDALSSLVESYVESEDVSGAGRARTLYALWREGRERPDTDEVIANARATLERVRKPDPDTR